MGGIFATNSYPAESIDRNLMVQANVIHAAHAHGMPKLLFLGLSCIYPKLAQQPMLGDVLSIGPLASSIEPCALSKVAAIKLSEVYNCQYLRDYRGVITTNIYGPGDCNRPENSHIIPALIYWVQKTKIYGALSGEFGGQHPTGRVPVCERQGCRKRARYEPTVGPLADTHAVHEYSY